MWVEISEGYQRERLESESAPEPDILNYWESGHIMVIH